MILEELYNNYVDTSKCFVKYEELNQIIDKINTLLNNNPHLEETNITTLLDLITEYKCVAQKQGFVTGFQYAVQMLKECI